MNGRAIFNSVFIALLIIATIEIAEACKKCGQDACSCNSHHRFGGHHRGGSIGHQHYQSHLGLCHSANHGYGCGHHGGFHSGMHGCLHGGHRGGLHGNLHSCGGVHGGSGCGFHVGGTYGIGGGLHVGGGYGLGGGGYIIGGYGSTPPICNICGGYANDSGLVKRRHWKPRCRCY